MLNMIKACTVAQDKVEDAKSLLVTNGKIDNQAWTALRNFGSKPKYPANVKDALRMTEPKRTRVDVGSFYLVHAQVQ